MIGPSFPHVLVAAQRGDEQAFDMLWRDLHPAMLRYLQVMAPAAAEDLAADTWIGVVQELCWFVGDESGFRALVFTAARRRAIDWRRRMNRQRIAPVPVELIDGWAAPDDPAAATPEGWSTRAALAVIAELPPAQAEVVALRVLGGLSVAEVAQITGNDPNVVRALSHRGLTSSPGGYGRLLLGRSRGLRAVRTLLALLDEDTAGRLRAGRRRSWASLAGRPDVRRPARRPRP